MALSAPSKRTFTPEEYLELERKANYKSEYVDGEIFAQAGASEPHNLIVAQTIVELGVQLKGSSCKVFPSDIRVHVEKANRYTYPDVTVLCGETLFADDRKDTITNPTVVIEVLSPSSEAYDRGGKFAAYRTLASLQTYILISQDQALIEVFERQDESWLLNAAKGLEASAHVKSIDCAMQLADIYAFVDFEVSD